MTVNMKMLQLRNVNNIRTAFTPDKHVFNILLGLNVTFTFLLIIGCSIPAWNVVDENVPNFRNCSSADHYVGHYTRRTWDEGPTQVTLASSLWYVNLKVAGRRKVQINMLPFVSLAQNKLPDRIGGCEYICILVYHV